MKSVLRYCINIWRQYLLIMCGIVPLLLLSACQIADVVTKEIKSHQTHKGFRVTLCSLPWRIDLAQTWSSASGSHGFDTHVARAGFPCALYQHPPPSPKWTERLQVWALSPQLGTEVPPPNVIRDCSHVCYSVDSPLLELDCQSGQFALVPLCLLKRWTQIIIWTRSESHWARSPIFCEGFDRSGYINFSLPSTSPGRSPWQHLNPPLPTPPPLTSKCDVIRQSKPKRLQTVTRQGNLPLSSSSVILCWGIHAALWASRLRYLSVPIRRRRQGSWGPR